MYHPATRAERRLILESRKAQARRRLETFGQPEPSAVGRAAAHPTCACALCRRESWQRHHEAPWALAKAPSVTDWA